MTSTGTLEPPPTRDDISRAFGPAALEGGVFYVHDPALRFELSTGGTYVEMFTSAFDRAREILRHLFAESPSLAVVLVSQRDAAETGTLLGSLSVFRSMRACGIPVPRPCGAWCEPSAEWEGAELRCLAFRCGREMVPRLLWGALAADIGIRPRLDSRVYIADLQRGVLVHPYDDRGMDVVGPRAVLHELYLRFNDWLLDYDRGRMDAMFGQA